MNTTLEERSKQNSFRKTLIRARTADSAAVVECARCAQIVLLVAGRQPTRERSGVPGFQICAADLGGQHFMAPCRVWATGEPPPWNSRYMRANFVRCRARAGSRACYGILLYYS